MTLILVVATLTLLASFVCSLLEAALYAITPAQIEVLRVRKAQNAERLARLQENIEEPIAAILTINTIAHTIGASVCGALVGAEYGSAAVGVFAAVFTVLVLALTEIIPKSLGVRYAWQLGTRITWPLQLMIWLVWPLVWLARKATRLVAGSSGTGPSEEEVVALSRLAARSGVLSPEEHRWVRNALRLNRVTAGEIRTPRPVVETIPADTLIADVVKDPSRWVHSRVPVVAVEGDDQIIGLMRRREAFDAASSAGALRVRDIMHAIEFVPESMSARVLLSKFVGQRVHMLGILDQYGTFQGVVTLEDVLESLLGEEIVDEHDVVEDWQAFARTRRDEDEEEGEQEKS